MRLFLLTMLFLLLGSAFASADYGFVFDNSRLHLEWYSGNHNAWYWSQPYDYYANDWYYFGNAFRYYSSNQYYYYNPGWYNFYAGFYNDPYAFNYYPNSYAYYSAPYYYYPTYNPLARGTTISIIDPAVSPQSIPQKFFSKGALNNSYNGYPVRPFPSADNFPNPAIVPTEQIVDLTDGAESQGSWLVSESGLFEAEKVLQPSTAPLKEFNVVITENGYSPNAFTAQQGDLVRFWVLTQSGTESHNHGIAIDSYGINESVNSSAIPTIIELWATRAGTFRVYCKSCLGGSLGDSHPTLQATLMVKGTNAFPQSDPFKEPFPSTKPSAQEIAGEKSYQSQFFADLQPAPVSTTPSMKEKIEWLAPSNQTIFGDGAVSFTVNNYSNSALVVKAHGNGLRLAQSEFFIQPNTSVEKAVLVDSMSVPKSYLVLELYRNGERLQSKLVSLSGEAKLEPTPEPVPLPEEPEPEQPTDENQSNPILRAFGVGFAFLANNWLAGLIAVLILGIAYWAFGREPKPYQGWPK